MTDHFTMLLAQQNPTVGDIAGNAALLREARAAAAAAGAALVVSSELFLSGYPPEDLVLRPAFIDQVEATIAALVAETGDGGPGAVFGAPCRDEGKLYNTAFLIADGKVAARRHKHLLPNYGPFDEKRVFDSGALPGPAEFRAVRLGLVVCEDMWTPEVCECLAETGAEMLLVINGSPFDMAKRDQRSGLARARVEETGLPLVYVNQVGGQDELVFDGASFVVNPDGQSPIDMPAWRDALVACEWRRGGDDTWRCKRGTREEAQSELAGTYLALMTGLRDYIRKNGFPGIVLGLSGGIDSALTAAVAVDAIGADKVHCVLMPSQYTSQASLDDAADCAAALGMRLDTISIGPAVAAYDVMLKDAFHGRAADATEENIQARARAMTLMAISNKFGHMLLTTGNKSEMSVGYATLYGDLCGGYSVLKDVYKTTVFDLSEWRNQNVPVGAHGPSGVVIPDNIISKPPSAELKPNQTDQDTLPPYSVLDAILKGLIEHERSFAELVERGHDAATVERVARMLYRAEYKRRQAPPGVKISQRSFGRDRRYPITNAFREAT